MKNPGHLDIVGIGPGSPDHLTAAAAQALRRAEFVFGYQAYLDQVARRLRGKHVIPSQIGQEMERASQAIDLACAGHRVALVSGGDAGVYGMAGPVFEVLAARGWRPGQPPSVRLVPGVSAAQAAAAAVGAPLMQDYAVISLSDLLTPWEAIARRLEAAAGADFVIALYNPASGRRTWQLGAACEILLRHRRPDTPVALARDASRPTEQVTLTDLAHLAEAGADMRTTILIGSSQTFRVGPLLITPRGYEIPPRLLGSRPCLS